MTSLPPLPHDLPAHVAIIMDGNGRWAREREQPRIAGHRAGERAVRDAVDFCGRAGIRHLTLYTFSAENWRRSPDEVYALMRLIEYVARRQVQELHRNNVRLRLMGRVDELPAAVRDELLQGVQLTRENSGLQLILAINYGGRAEIADAARSLASDVKAGLLQPAEIGEQEFARRLYLPDLPDPDLIIRTGGDLRLSNFLLWQAAYSELWVTNTFWPDFGPREFASALWDYARRERRFGGVLQQTTGEGQERG